MISEETFQRRLGFMFGVFIGMNIVFWGGMAMGCISWGCAL